MPLLGNARECLRIMGPESIQSLRGTLIAKLTDKLHPIGRAWSLKVSKLPSPADIKTRRKHAGKLYFQPLIATPPEILAFADDAIRFLWKTCDVSKQWDASLGIADEKCSLLSIAHLIKTMCRCSEAINDNVLDLFKEHYDDAVSYCSQNSRLCALLKSFPTSYLASSKKALDEENKVKADCRADTLLLQSKIGSMKNIDQNTPPLWFLMLNSYLVLLSRNNIKLPNHESIY